MSEPSLVDVQDQYLVGDKPPGIHSAPLKDRVRGETLLDWCAREYPEVLRVGGRHSWEGGLLHRLDYETSGLLLVARTQAALDDLRAQQEQGKFLKEYGAWARKTLVLPPGFPPAPFQIEGSSAIGTAFKITESGSMPFKDDFVSIESGFRPYGPGRKAVRPVPGELNRGPLYQTRILRMERRGDCITFRLGISRGFRHQFRCHLAWLGYPLLGDTLYGGAAPAGDGLEAGFPAALALRAQRIAFADPATGEGREYSIP
jgi:23S rRNA pseudouridine1911/1915/1917 synthase